MHPSFLKLLCLFVQLLNPQTPRIATVTLKSSVFGNERVIRVYVPKEYDGKETFKVLYLNDGQNLFGDNLIGSEREWRADEILDSLIAGNQIEPLIVVGIDNAGSARGNEYLPWEDIYLNPPVPNPQGSRYPEFLTKEVMPFIEERFKVKTGRLNTGIGGSSYGALISMYTALQKPEVFGFVLIESPSLYVNEQKLLTMAQQRKWKWPAQIYFGIGTNELAIKNCGTDNEDNKMAVKDVVILKNYIEQQSAKSKIKLLIDSCAIHHENAWAKRLPVALKFLLPKR